MKTFVRTLLIASISLAMAPAMSQETNGNEISGKSLLEKLEQKVSDFSTNVVESTEKVTVPVVTQRADVAIADLPVIKRSEKKAAALEPVTPKATVEPETEVGGLELMVDSNLAMPLRELPTGSRFTFSKTLFFPANTIALLYNNGQREGKIYQGGEPLDSILSMSDTHHSACTIMSDKSYIKLKGTDSSTNPTYIDFDKLEYIQDGESNRIIYQLLFQSKSAGSSAVNIKMSCVLPVAKNDQVPMLDMQHVVDAFGQSFTFEPPKYVEL